jgi:hypothetical protein
MKLNIEYWILNISWLDLMNFRVTTTTILTYLNCSIWSDFPEANMGLSFFVNY